MAAPGSGSALPGSVDVVEEWSTLVSGDADASADNAGSPSALLMLRSAVAKTSHLRSASKYLSSQLQAKRQAANAAEDDDSSLGTKARPAGQGAASSADEDGVPAIVRAAADGDAAELRRLIATLPSDPSKSVAEELNSIKIADGAAFKDSPGQNAVIKAARNNHRRCVQLLLEAGADPQVTDEKWRSAWYYACFGVNIKKGEHKDMVKLLTQAGTDRTDVASVITSEVVLCTCVPSRSRSRSRGSSSLT